MQNEKRYRYKLWLEVERVEIDEQGNEVKENQRGETFGYDPEKLYQCDNFISGLNAVRQDIIDVYKH